MRVWGVMVTRNEANRFLDSVLGWHKGVFDGIHVYDDCSTDETVDVALSHGCVVTPRPPEVPSFLEHESDFRQASWRAFEEALGPVQGDWVLALDADEFLVSPEDEGAALRAACIWAETQAAVGVILHVPEVFRVTEDEDGMLLDPHVRVDGLWGSIAGPRLFQYHPMGVFSGRPMGSGSEPTYVAQGRLVRNYAMHLMHYGYSDPADARAKYERYSSMAHGHLDAHVRSIVEEPELARWQGSTIPVRRARKVS